ncbi:type IVB secretion system protein IcmH/DotU [Francisella uliginis]|uniref:Type IV / VI secretion system DotU domain-containing protein n=1 Tax=Francisella uliginis TaxID=573570 RepID=A0A1L4BTP6_9GAMM|nr:type IVB secretion system protein IcmH/DotU [Francisella uliginis]API87209.1 hypothetical protein F7310_07470 [Francisella uliginis]
MSLMSSYSEIISYVIALKNNNFKDLDISKFRENLDLKFEEAKREILITYKDEDYQNSLFAICAWIDETVLCSSWKEKSEWKKAMLQQSFFGTAEAGEIFFEKLSNTPPNNIEVLEVYYYCMKLGFRGMFYRPNDITILNEKIKKIYKLIIDEYDGEFEKPLNSCALTPIYKTTKNEQVKKSSKKLKPKKIGLWLIPIAPFVIVSVIFNVIVMVYF